MRVEGRYVIRQPVKAAYANTITHPVHHLTVVWVGWRGGGQAKGPYKLSVSWD